MSGKIVAGYPNPMRPPCGKRKRIGFSITSIKSLETNGLRPLPFNKLASRSPPPLEVPRATLRPPMVPR